jgi:dihydrodiol dehydrogenase / D-xylose 1-dehydrogenase (NADP)
MKGEEEKQGILTTSSHSIANKFSKDLLIDPNTRDVSDVRHSITAVASSTSKERAEEFIKDVGADKQSDVKNVAAYGNYDDFVKDENVDIVYVATPHSHHYENVLTCLDAGKHVCCEVRARVERTVAAYRF